MAVGVMGPSRDKEDPIARMLQLAKLGIGVAGLANKAPEAKIDPNTPTMNEVIGAEEPNKYSLGVNYSDLSGSNIGRRIMKNKLMGGY